VLQKYNALLRYCEQTLVVKCEHRATSVFRSVIAQTVVLVQLFITIITKFGLAHFL
jgi:hypothetical protein